MVIGAGIAGLAAAWELTRRGLAPIVLEASPRAGGVILTEQVDGFTIDAGPDALLVQKPAAVALCREIGLGDRLMPSREPRTAFVKRGGVLIPLPDASVLGFPTRVGPFLRTPLFSWRGKARMAMEPLLPAARDVADESIAAFIGRRFGSEAVRYLAEPLLAGIHAGDVDRLSMPALFPRLAEAERTHGSVLRALRAMRARPAAAQGAFVSLPGGMGELVAALVAQLPAEAVRCNTRVVCLSGAGPYNVVIGGGKMLTARAVVVAAPAWAVAPMIAPLDPDLARLCGEIRYTSSAIAVFALRAEQVGHPLDGSGYVVPRGERRGVTAATWITSKWDHRAPPGFVLLRAFLGGAGDPEAVEHTDEAIVDLAWRELATTLAITGSPLLTRVYRWRRASAQHDVGHLARVRAIDARLAQRAGLFFTGSGFRGTGIPDCVADARATAAGAAEFLQ